LKKATNTGDGRRSITDITMTTITTTPTITASGRENVR
jgi:hypothetical protein